ncbi:hypothetical protein [Plantactinospora sp. KBS50]|uniref:hypothetical protein n=1 Tax=Plantactinospora sp. KBS50 TaxID=2024580 RepID=UPI001E646F47|nr:hypothetical protein [Plantactinospora sp. KBS50]
MTDSAAAGPGDSAGHGGTGQPAGAGDTGAGHRDGDDRPRPGRFRWGRIAEPVRDAAFRRDLLHGAGLLLGTLVIAIGFITSYAGALHNPHPRRLPVAVVAGDTAAQQLLAGVRTQTDAIRARTYASPQAAADALGTRDAYALLSAGPGGLVLTTASAASPAATQTITTVFTTAARTANAPLDVTDRYPTSTQDPRGLVPFYLAIGLVLGGYLATAALGVTLGTAPRSFGRAGLRIGAFAIYSALLGLAGALVTGPALGVFDRHLGSIAVAGMLVVFASTLVAAAVQSWLGLVGTGLVIVLLVVLGNPGSGGIYAPEFLPGIFAQMHQWNIPGLATDLIKSVAYFPDPQAAHWPLLELVLWGLAGLIALLFATGVMGRGPAPRHHR